MSSWDPATWSHPPNTTPVIRKEGKRKEVNCSVGLRFVTLGWSIGRNGKVDNTVPVATDTRRSVG